jgi:HEPN domain-containing protein
MPPDPLEDAREWLAHATTDLQSCELLLGASLLGPATYHAQQAAEKALKAFLVGQLQRLWNTHDVGALVSRCAALDASFASLTAAAARLTPFAVLYRYPGPGGELHPGDALAAYADALSILELVRRKLAA